ncbi:hypothetical protein MPSI1_002123 [Malassezia psittaci]|uniref:J domain-containing protein n=1 Tax=Malassezia psittaci TaxID=1821823 RepID=A0AAF0F5J2_9BASI|nr:hypothetical protein MPSI1_002123 [Malassezia psittaci]
MEQDPARMFFPTGKVDLYDVLGLDRNTKPSQEMIKKAYKKRALQCHPDKAGLRGEQGAEDAARTFQQVGFAYSVLSDEKKRKRYDATGSTSDFAMDDQDIDWQEYFKNLWDGEVNADTLQEFKQKYQGSEEERTDVLKAYRDTKGSLEKIFASVPCSEILVDEQRIIDMVQAAIEVGEIDATKKWKALYTQEGQRKRKALKTRARKEAKEAESYAKELGVYETLYKKPKKSLTATASSHADKDDIQEEDLDALRAAMQKKSGERQSAFDAMIQRIEHNSTATPPPKRRRNAQH